MIRLPGVYPGRAREVPERRAERSPGRPRSSRQSHAGARRATARGAGDPFEYGLS